MVVLSIVCGSNLCQQASDHFDDVGNGHFADLVLGPNVCGVSPLPPRERPGLGEGACIIDGEALDVRQALNFDPSR